MIALAVNICGMGPTFALIPIQPRGKTSKSCHTQFLAIFAHNVNFPGKLEKFSENFFLQNDSISCKHLSNGTVICIGLFHFLSVQGDGSKKFKSIFALDFFDMNILPPGKQLGEFSVSLEFHLELPSIFASFVLSKCQWM